MEPIQEIKTKQLPELPSCPNDGFLTKKFTPALPLKLGRAKATRAVYFFMVVLFVSQ
ncbi:MAG: hypothetical protein LBV12_00490 [Puniceicoccales bacterium]|jgi:hypothetical protein|nr:hypothetical protein [Puniceicoccales bacterium]